MLVSVPLCVSDCRAVALALSHQARQVNGTLGRVQSPQQAAAAAELVLTLDRLASVFGRASSGSLLADVPVPPADPQAVLD